MSFAYSILVVTAGCTGATLVACDHTELDPVERYTANLVKKDIVNNN